MQLYVVILQCMLQLKYAKLLLTGDLGLADQTNAKHACTTTHTDRRAIQDIPGMHDMSKQDT